LDGHKVDARVAYALIERGVTVADLDAAVPAFDAGQLARVLRYLAADHAVHGLIAEISSATNRIHALVAAVKKHTHMDRALAPGPIRLEEHLADTVTLTSATAARKRVSVELRVEADLPTSHGVGRRPEPGVDASRRQRHRRRRGGGPDRHRRKTGQTPRRRTGHR
jgi:hypothetical protein